MYYFIVVLFLLLLYSMMPTTAASEISATREQHQRLSIRLCCEPSDFFNTTSYQCERQPQAFNLTSSWDVTNFWADGNLTKVNILRDLNYKVERVPCEKPLVFKFFQYSNDTEHCYTPYYHGQRDKYIIATVDCAFVLQVYNYVYDTYLMGIGISSLFMIFTVIVYGILRKLSDSLHWKIFLCHFVSWLCAHIGVILSMWLMTPEMVLYIWLFFISSRLWLNVIGYEIFVLFLNSFRECDVQEFGRRRFSIYSLYVWGVSAVASLCSWFLKESKPLDNTVSLIPIGLICLLTSVAVGYLIFKLFRLRQNLLNMPKGKHFIRKSLPTLMCLIYTTIWPWTVFLLWLIYLKNIYIVSLFYISLIAEGPTMFIIFVPKRNILYFLGKKKSNRNDRNITSPVSEQVYSFETMN